MPSDKDKLMALCTELGIGFKHENDTTICCEQGDAMIVGYGGFYTLFEFTETGRFIRMGAYE